jgi:hypothetical protein
MLIVPPSIVLLGGGEHMEFRDAVERFFECKACVNRMTIYSKASEETVYVEFHPVAETPSNAAAIRALADGSLRVDRFVMRPQLVFS